MKYYVLMLSLLALSCSTTVKNNWNKKILDTFLLPLTYPQSDWDENDFGKDLSSEDKALLEKYRPQLYVSPKGLPPIDFYRDYLPKTNLMNPEKEIITSSPSRELLKKYERTSGYYLDYTGSVNSCEQLNCNNYSSKIYGRIYRGSIKSPYQEPIKNNYIVLKYSPVFTASGLPAKIPWYKAFGAWTAGDLDVWHELDIHGAIHILVNEETMEPQILLLAQHNHFRTYLIGKDIFLNAGKLNICFAQRSNEPYPCDLLKTDPQFFRTVGHPKNMRFVIYGQGAYIDGGYDAVYGPNAGAIEINYRIEHLPSKDPLYVSWVPLGDKLKIFNFFDSLHRKGPPGIDLNTFPDMPKYTDIAQIWYFADNDRLASELFQKAFTDFYNPILKDIHNYNGRRLWRAINELRKKNERQTLTN